MVFRRNFSVVRRNFSVVRRRVHGRPTQLFGCPTQLSGCPTQGAWSLEATFRLSDAGCMVVRSNFWVVRSSVEVCKCGDWEVVLPRVSRLRDALGFWSQLNCVRLPRVSRLRDALGFWSMYPSPSLLRERLGGRPFVIFSACIEARKPRVSLGSDTLGGNRNHYTLLCSIACAIASAIRSASAASTALTAIGE